MCGLTGFFSKNALNSESAQNILLDMNSQIINRGPDDEGIWIDKFDGIYIAHRRLSILELSNAGHQPMMSKSGRFIIAFNGEIYNHFELRKGINNHGWIGNSDTETLVESIEFYGLNETLSKIEGMFAFVLYDRIEKKIYLIRDRLGEKPLYYGWQGDTFLFGSNLKSFYKHPSFKKEIDLESLNQYIQYGYVTSNNCIFKGIKKVEPGCYISIQINQSFDQNILKYKYWELATVAKSGKENLFLGTEEEAQSQLKILLLDKVRDQMLSDVSLGAFLSGGIDSTLIVSMMQSLSIKPIKTFTIGFKEKHFDESKHAYKIAKFLGTDHHELIIDGNEFVHMIPELFDAFDEPFSDASLIPTYMVSQFAKKYVKVSLSGDGGDEIFGGYNRYNYISNINKLRNLFPKELRRFLGQFLAPGQYSDLLKINSLEELYDFSFKRFNTPGLLLNNGLNSKNTFQSNNFLNSYEKLLFIDTLNYLPDDILVKVDRAAMANSLETRIPLLNHKIIEFAWRLPFKHKFQNNETKRILKQILKGYIPSDFFERPKMGFGFPLAELLRGPLKDWAEELLSVDRLKNDGFFEVVIVRKIWEEHLIGGIDRHVKLFTILSFQVWYDNMKKY